MRDHLLGQTRSPSRSGSARMVSPADNHIIARMNKASTTTRCISVLNISDKNNVQTRQKVKLRRSRPMFALRPASQSQDASVSSCMRALGSRRQRPDIRSPDRESRPPASRTIDGWCCRPICRKTDRDPKQPA